MSTYIVCGSHKRGTKAHVFARLTELRAKLGITHVVTGGADYVDSLAVMWCMENKVSFTVEYPDWDRCGSRAGPMRNQRMLDKFAIHGVIAFDGDNGTADMKRRARAVGVHIYEQG